MKLRVGRRTEIVIPTPAEGRNHLTREGGNMYARLTTLSFRIEKADEGLRVFETSVVPAARAQKGFRAAYLLGDRKTGRSVAMTLWDDEAAAVANEDNRYYQEQLIKFLPIITSPPIKEGFEVELFVEAR
jgi:heme-degrading monooxygenase HmoA